MSFSTYWCNYTQTQIQTQTQTQTDTVTDKICKNFKCTFIMNGLLKTTVTLVLLPIITAVMAHLFVNRWTETFCRSQHKKNSIWKKSRVRGTCNDKYEGLAIQIKQILVLVLTSSASLIRLRSRQTNTASSYEKMKRVWESIWFASRRLDSLQLYFPCSWQQP